MLVVVAVVGLVVIGSIALFVIGVLDQRPQRWGLGCAAVAGVLYAVYYGDVLLPESAALARDVVAPLGLFGPVDPDFDSSIGVALALIPIYVIQAAIFLRVTADTTIGHVSDRIVNFVAGVTAAVLLGAIAVSALHGGYVLAGGYATCAVLAYAFAAFSKGIDGLAAAAGRHVLIRLRRATSTVVVRCARLVSAIISRGDRLSVKIADWTSRLHGANERQRDELRRQRQSENAALVDARPRPRPEHAQVGGASLVSARDSAEHSADGEPADAEHDLAGAPAAAGRPASEHLA